VLVEAGMDRPFKLHVVGSSAAQTSTPSAIDRLMAFVKERRDKPLTNNFAQFERDVHARMMEVERDLVGEELAKADIDRESLLIEGVLYRRVLRSTQTYETAAGPVEVERTLYKDRTDPEMPSMAVMDARLGIIDRRWTPLAAEQAVWIVSQMTPQLAEEAFARMGNMTPSKSSLDRLPKSMSARWESDREAFEAKLREAIEVPEGATTVAVSLDGVLAPMKDTDPVATRCLAAREGKLPKGPAGYREVGCATLSFCDAEGKMLSAIRMARMPEANKATLKKSLLAELMVVLRRRPSLRIAKVADGAKDNWTYLHGEVPEGPEVVDFYHAAEHLSAALGAAYGDGSVQTQRRFNDLRHVLRHDPEGVDKVISALGHLRRKHPQSKRIATELEYFRNNRHRMRYEELASQGIPIGSGLVEAACKTLVAQRLKCSGMRWGQEGGQAILTVRGWTQSERFDEAWALLAATYAMQVTTFDNVVDIRHPRARRASG
jgi:hypothetical protein